MMSSLNHLIILYLRAFHRHGMGIGVVGRRDTDTVVDGMVRVETFRSSFMQISNISSLELSRNANVFFTMQNFFCDD